MEQDYRQTKGRIFDIQRFSIHDGPGIRSIVFLKGCMLRCRWCCNPESQEFAIQQMRQADGKVKTVGRDVTVSEVMEELVKDRHYYRRSGGGVTLSGGESLCQPEFAVALLRACRENGLTTAMESTGFAPFERIERYLEYLDLFLMDIKHMNSGKHEQFTTRRNELILENARKIAQSGVELVIRVPVIPTFNDTVEEISDIARFAAGLPGVERLHLLPYHRLGKDKYDGLGREYLMGDVEPPTKQHMQQLLAAAERFGLRCQIGG